MAQRRYCSDNGGQNAPSVPSANIVACPLSKNKSQPSENTTTSLSTVPCPALSGAVAEDAQMFDVLPCPNIERFQSRYAVIVDVSPMDSKPKEPDPETERLERKQKAEERWKSITEVSDNIIPIDYPNPDLNNSPLDDCIILCYANQGSWEKLIELSANLLKDERLPCDFDGELDEEHDDNYKY
ncbi:uncharacterized protein LOC130449830 [Diorhabda sublineata]|uniref:uncharacterized protein LOC130449830 n=1 Tax=Diorhabda sublineata TaxID=1163346 RepID=UPI0024E08D0F|nr:uncharacterized protein LOC130449830 [Diorhabda sublineata]